MPMLAIQPVLPTLGLPTFLHLLSRIHPPSHQLHPWLLQPLARMQPRMPAISEHVELQPHSRNLLQIHGVLEAFKPRQLHPLPQMDSQQLLEVAWTEAT